MKQRFLKRASEILEVHEEGKECSLFEIVYLTNMKIGDMYISCIVGVFLSPYCHVIIR